MNSDFAVPGYFFLSRFATVHLLERPTLSGSGNHEFTFEVDEPIDLVMAKERRDQLIESVKKKLDDISDELLLEVSNTFDPDTSFCTEDQKALILHHMKKYIVCAQKIGLSI